MPLRKDLSLSMPNQLRNVPNEVAVAEREREVPVAWRGDWNLVQYVNNYTLKAAGIGFVSSPYTSLWDRIWGVTPIEDLPKYKALYSFVPRVQARLRILCALCLDMVNAVMEVKLRNHIGFCLIKYKSRKSLCQLNFLIKGEAVLKLLQHKVTHSSEVFLQFDFSRNINVPIKTP